MHATPDGSKESRHDQLKRLVDAGKEPEGWLLPDAGELDYLVGFMFEIGPGIEGKPMAWAELNAWKSATGTRINPAECLGIRSLATAYQSELQSAKDPFRVHPGGDRAIENANRLKAAFRKMT